MLRALTAGVLLVLAASAAAEPRPVAGPAYGQALFDFYQGEYFDALVGLEAARGRDRLHPDDQAHAELLRAGLMLAYGLGRGAEAAFRQLLQQPEAEALRDTVWLKLGDIARRRGDARASREALLQVAETAPAGMRQSVRLSLGLLELQLDRPAEALQWLGTAAGPDESPYLAFNRAVALGRLQRADEALAELRRIGRAGSAANAELLELRDRANLAAGFQALGAGEAQAGADFNRIRLHSASAGLALLGAGWAHAREGDFAAALVPWQALLEADPYPVPALEGRLALAFARARLGDGVAAEAAYQSALGEYSRQLASIDAARSAVQSERLFEALAAPEAAGGYTAVDAALRALRALPGAAQMQAALADAEFRRLLAEYRELIRLRSAHQRRQADLVTFETMLAARRARFAQVLPGIADRLDELQPERYRRDRDQLLARLDAAQDEAPWGLASAEELAMRDDLQDLLVRAEGLPDAGQAASLRSRLLRLRGVLQWRVEAAYVERRWRVRKQLRAVDALLGQLDAHRQRLEQAPDTASDRLAELSARLRSQATRLRELAPRIDLAMQDVGRQLQVRLSAGLQERQAQLRSFMRQARFGLAELYDGSLAGEVRQ